MYIVLQFKTFSFLSVYDDQGIMGRVQSLAECLRGDLEWWLIIEMVADIC